MRSKADLHDYQAHAAQHIIDNPYCGLFMEMGLGKTASSLTAIDRLVLEEVEIDRVLVVAPKRVVESVWRQETAEWQHLQQLRVVAVRGKVRHRKAALKQDAHVYVISRDNIQWLCAQYGGSGLPFQMLVIDESSSFKNHKSKRFKALKAVHFQRVVLLTGTPTPKGLIDLWAPMYLLDKGKRLGRTIGEYRSNYFTPGAKSGHIVYNYRIKKGSADKIYEAIGDICISMKEKDYLKTAGEHYNPIYIDMPDALKKRYQQFERDKVLEIYGTGEEITPANAAALRNKLLQFANGAIYDSEKNYHVIHDLKLEALEEIMEEANGKSVLVAYTLKSDAERIMAHFAQYEPRKLSGDKDIADWNAGKIQMMIMHPASGGHGLNFQYGGHIAVWFGQTDSLELYLQFNKRLARQGQKFKVFIHEILLRGTMDEDVRASNKLKDEGQNALMAAVKARINKYLKRR